MDNRSDRKCAATAGVVLAAWKRNLEDLRQNKRMFKKWGILENETTFLNYLEVVEIVEKERLKGNVTIPGCPTENAWEGKCEEPSSIVSNWCALHAASYDDRQVFFTSCSQCREIKLKSQNNRSAENVAFFYHQKANLCLGHQVKAIEASRKKPQKRRQSSLVLEVEEQQKKCIPEVVARFLQKYSTRTVIPPPLDCSMPPELVLFLEEMTPPVTPDPILCQHERPYYQDESLNLNIEEVVLDSPLPQEDIKAVLADIFEEDSLGDGEDLMEMDLLSCGSQDSLTNHVDWTMQVLDEMDWRLLETETLR